MKKGTRVAVLVLFLGALATALPGGTAAGASKQKTPEECANKARAAAQELAEQLTYLLDGLIKAGRTEEAQKTLQALKQVLDAKEQVDALADRIESKKAAGAHPKSVGPILPPDLPIPPSGYTAPPPPLRLGPALGGRLPDHKSLLAEGGSVKTEKAVALGLDWLARHQDPSGFWDCDGFQKMCKLNICSGTGGALYDPGVTGLSLLAFLGAGDTHRHGPYQRTVRNGLSYLEKIQDAEGCFGPRTTPHFTYNHAIDTLAMVKAYAESGSPLFKKSAQAGIDFVMKCQNPYLAWRYGVRPGDNDTSVSGWMTMALHAAKEAHLRVDRAGFDGMKAWLDKVTEPEYGRVGYTTRGSGPARPQGRQDQFPSDKSDSLTAVGILCRVYIGEDPGKSDIIQKGTALCLKNLPDWDTQAGTIDMYYWYFGTMAMFQVGGRSWRTWNAALKPALLDHQRLDADEKGSWDPIGVWGKDGGRIYSTALSTMMMETYYRCHRINR